MVSNTICGVTWAHGLAAALGDAFAPARCAGCDALSREPVCASCSRALRALEMPPPARVPVGLVLAAFEYVDPVRTVIHHAKYRAGLQALQVLTGIAVERMAARHHLRGDAVVAVPLGRRRRKQRGYNQADVVAASLAARHGLRVVEGLVRVRETRAQSARDADARKRNVAGAFAWQGAAIAGARLWLADDIVTTGATAAAAAEALLAAGASRVGVVALARVP